METLPQSSLDTRKAFDWLAADAYLFDIDGTLMNAHGRVHDTAFRNALSNAFGFQSDLSGVPVHGSTDPAILRAVASKFGIESDHFDQKLPEIIEAMCEEVQSRAQHIRTEICPSIVELLDLLSSKGKLLGIVTGNLEVIGWTKIQCAGLRHYFSFGAFSDRAEHREDIVRAAVLEVKRRLGEEAVSYIIGDTPNDIAAARKAGVPVISVATGVFSRSKLSEYDPDMTIACCSELFSRE